MWISSSIVGASAATMLRGWIRERAPAARNRGLVMAGYVIAQMVIDSMVPAFSFISHLAGALVGFTATLLLGDRLGRDQRVAPAPDAAASR